MVDEVEEAAVGPLEVFEQEDRRSLLGDALEEDPPRGKENVASSGRRRLEAEECQQCWLDPPTIGGIGDVLVDGRVDAFPSRLFIVRLGQASASPHHLAECPERDPVAICR